VTEIKGTSPVSEISPKRNPEERNIRKQLGRVRRNLAASTNPNIRSLWEGRITTCKTQLAKAEARARFIK
jgi:hypothetical protein